MMSETVVTVDPSRNPQQPNQPKPTAPPPNQLAWVKINVTYFRTVPGLLKLVQVVLGIICMACASPAWIGATHFFLFVAVTSFIATMLWTFVYLLGIREVLNLAINWILTEFLNTVLKAVLYLIASLVQLIVWSGYYGGPKPANITAGVFGIFLTIAYAIGAYLLYIEHKSGTTQ